MVRAVDMEGIMQKYVEGDDLERADALCLLYTAGSSEAAKTLRARYGRSGALSSVLDDLKMLGITEVNPYEGTEDTGELLVNAIQDSFVRMFLNSVMESAKKRATALSRSAREILYLISVMYSEGIDKRINTHDLRKFYKLLFRKTITDHEFEVALDELKGCYIIQYSGGRYREDLVYPSYFEDLLPMVGEVIPKVEVRVSWPEE